jgi:hypothetical protein
MSKKQEIEIKTMLARNKVKTRDLFNLLHTGFVSENLEFLMAVTDFEKITKGAQPVHGVLDPQECNTSSLAQIGSYIYLTWIGENSLRQVNISATMRNVLRDKNGTIMGMGGITAGDLKPAYKEIMKVLIENINQTPKYRDFLA